MSSTLGKSDASADIDQRLVRAVAHPLRIAILKILHGRKASPNEISLLLRKPLGNVTYHIDVLRKNDAIEEVDRQKKRGATEHFYTTTPRSTMGHQDWRRVPLAVRAGVTNEAVATFVSMIGAAIDADTIDQRDDTTLNSMPIIVDEPGWLETAEILDQARRDLTEVHGKSRHRLGGADGIPVITGLAAFEIPPARAGRALDAQ
jgi:DNA-binding transcriptional ArsR family regulator